MPYMCSKSAFFLESNEWRGPWFAKYLTREEKPVYEAIFFFLEIEVEQLFWCQPFLMRQSAETKFS